MNYWRRAIDLAGTVIFWGVIPLATYSLGLLHGYRDGTQDGVNAVMCTMSRISNQPLGKGDAKYCADIAARMIKRTQ